MAQARHWAPSSRHVPDDVYAELVDLLFTSLLPVVIIGLALGGAGALIAARLGDAVAAGLATAGVLTSAGRAVLILAYRRHAAARTLTRETARTWERRYAVGSVLFAGLLGLFDARVTSVGDPLAHMLVTGLIFGYGAGLVTRLAVRPTICGASLLIAALPTALAMALRIQGGLEQGLAYGGQALLVAMFALGSLETINHAYSTTLGQLLTKRNLARMAHEDALTGLPNRIMLRERFDEDLARIHRGDELVALHFLDLDRFKAVNDRFGHPTGDLLLQAVAARLSGVLRAGDTAARLGGDEFVIVQTRARHPDEAAILARRIIRVISAPYEIAGHSLSIGTSVGIAMAPQDGLDLDQLAARADAALYRAKTRQRGTIAFWADASDLKEAV